uniref:Chromatin modification-related protein MEAF6 n=1 Tax=Rhizophora mucronata TaxID=61149 RepID=A0A2P2J9E2_RHIMU
MKLGANMKPQGQKGGSSPSPAAMLASHMGKREKLQEELRNIEKQVYELETSYLEDSTHFVSVLKGFDGFLSSSRNTTNNGFCYI